MKSRKRIALVALLLAALTAIGFSAYTQVNPEALKRGVQIEPKPPLPLSPVRPQQTPPAPGEANDLASLKAELRALQQRVNRLEREVQDLRRPKMQLLTVK